MILTIKNQTANPLSYLQGIVTVTANGNTVVPRDFNTLLMSDATFLSDGTSGVFLLNNGASDLSGPSILILAQVFASFSTDSIATLPLYYSAPIKINQTAGTAASSTVWTMRNAAASLKQVVIERIFLISAFDNATPLGVNTLVYNLRRFSGATPTGGVAITPVLMDNLSPATSVTDIRILDTGLTVAGVSFENPFCHIPCPEIRGGVIHYERAKMAMKLAAGEGLAIQLTNAAVNGQSLYGEIVWSER